MKTTYIDYETRTIADVISPDQLMLEPGDPFYGYAISRINVPREHRGKGLGSAMLRRVLEDADKEEVDLYLVVCATGALNDEQLAEWYGRYGFIADGRGGMVRKHNSGSAVRKCKVF